MRVELHDAGWSDFRPWLAKSGNVAGSFAWAKVAEDGVGHIYIRRGMDRVLWGLARVGHELEHMLDPDFRNKDHHPAGHFCLRSYNFVRKWEHGLFATQEKARLLRKQRFLES